MRKCILRLFIVVLGLCLLAGPAWSATAGKITGRVTDQSGKPLPGVNVAVQGTRLGAVSDADGYYLILSVEPGIYELKASIIGYEAVREKNVQVFADRTTTRNFTLKETAVAGAEVVVQAERPLIEMDQTSSETKISEKVIEQVPIIRDAKEHLQFAAGVDPTNILHNNVRIRRTPYYAYFRSPVTWTLDGIELTSLDTERGFPRQYTNVPVTTIGEMAVIKTGGSAEEVSSQAGVVNVVSREGSRDLHGGIDFRADLPAKRHFGPNVYDALPGQVGGANGYWQNRLKWNDPAWVNEVDPVTGKTIHVKQDYEGAVGHFVEGWVTGPLGKNATFVVSGKTSQDKQSFPASQRIGPRQWSLFGKLAFTPSDNLKLKFGYNQSSEPRWRGDQRGVGSNLFLVRDQGYTGYEQQWRNRVIYMTATHTLSPKTFHEFQIGFYGTNIDTTENTDRRTGIWRRDKAGQFFLDRENRTLLSVDYNRRYSFRYDFTSQASRRNLFKAGLTYQLFHNKNWEYQQGSPSAGSVFLIGEDGVLGKRYKVNRLQAYAQDKIEFQGLIVNAGLRYDVVWGGPRRTLGSWYKGMAAYRSYKAFRTITPLAHTKPMWYISPRVGVSHPMTAHSVLRYSFGQYYMPHNFAHVWQEGWNGQDMINHPTLDDTWIDEPWLAGGGWRTDMAYNRPVGDLPNTTQFEVAGEWNFTSDYVLEIAAYYRRTEYAPSGVVRDFKDPVHGRIIVNGPIPYARADAKGTEFSVFKSLSHNFSFRAAVDVGWMHWSYSSSAPANIEFYPDSTYIAGPHYFLTDSKGNPRRLTEAEIRDIGSKANRILKSVIAGGTYIDGYTKFVPPRPLREREGLSDSERNMSEIQGLWVRDNPYAILWIDPSPAATQASFQFLWSTPSNWGPGPVVGGSKLLGGIQANLVWRFDSGNTVIYNSPALGTQVSRRGPMFVRTDLNFQKTFNAEKVQPTFYVEVFNLFNALNDRTAADNYVRWGLKLPTPNDGNYRRYGDPSPWRGSTPRYVNAGVRIKF